MIEKSRRRQRGHRHAPATPGRYWRARRGDQSDARLDDIAATGRCVAIAAVFRLAAEKLAEAEEQYRTQRAEQIIRNSTRKAVIGALAAVSPGTDVVIQGYIGTAMTQELCNLYGAAPRDIDVEDFLNAEPESCRARRCR